jgi:hypothetical protein
VTTIAVTRSSARPPRLHAAENGCSRYGRGGRMTRPDRRRQRPGPGRGGPVTALASPRSLNTWKAEHRLSRGTP